MFLPARMRKLKIITFEKYTDPVIRFLHEEGITQIDNISERIQEDPQWAQLLKPSKPAPQTTRIASLLMRTTGIIDFMNTLITRKKKMKEVIKEFLNPPIPKKRKVEELDSESLIKKAEDELSKVETRIKSLESKLNQLEAEKGDLESTISLWEKLVDFDIDFTDIEESKYITAIVGKMPIEKFKKAPEKIKEITDEFAIFDVETEPPTERKVFIITLKEHEDAIATLLRRMDLERFEIAGLKGKPSEVIQKSRERLKEIHEERKATIKEVEEIKNEWEEELLILKEQLTIEKERNEIYAAFGETENTVMLEAWTPLKDCEKAEEIIKEASEGHCVIEREKPNPDDEVPILLENPRFAKPFETFIKMYSPPKYNEYDPTVFMAIVLPFFFGFCLTDAFYGIIDALVGFILYKGPGKVNKFMRSFGIIFMACGLWAFILGMVTNGFLGDFFPRFFHINLPTVIPLVDAFKKPQNVLLMALIAGVLHINFGLIVGARNNIKMGNIREAMGSQIVWLILELGILLAALGWLFNIFPLMVGGGGIAVLGIILLVYYNGLFGLIDASGFLGTILSYSRLLALCLSTGGMAMTVNIVTEICANLIPVIGVALAPIIFVFGHIANDTFQSLGAFIHSLRLHYVEFFSQFFMGAKRKFDPFSAERKLTKIER
ncbi:MAG TPA: V-type ATP synthase subunit I [Methanothermobacter sp.]|nr:V-type ATP synthase subunit I [Methanothermobacter sp.]